MIHSHSVPCAKHVSPLTIPKETYRVRTRFKKLYTCFEKLCNCTQWNCKTDVRQRCLQKDTLPVLPTADSLFYDYVKFKTILSYKIGLGQSLKDQSIHMFVWTEVLPIFVPFKDNWISNKVLVKLCTLGPAYNE